MISASAESRGKAVGHDSSRMADHVSDEQAHGARPYPQDGAAAARRHQGEYCSPNEERPSRARRSGHPVTASVATELAERALRDRAAAYEEEVRRLLDAAYAVLRRTGELEPRVSDVVREAGLSNQAFYRHFRSKDELLLAVLDDGQRRLLATLEARMARVGRGRTPRAGVGRGCPRTGAAARCSRQHAPVRGQRSAARRPVPRAMVTLARSVARPAACCDRRMLAATPEDDAAAIYHLAFGTMQDALVRRAQPTDADVDYVVACSITIVEQARAMTSSQRSLMHTEQRG